jgi:hypothetical protein
MDPEHTVLMTSSRYCYFNYAGNYNTDSNFYIMECLGLMAAIPRWMLGQRHTWWSRVPKAPSTYQVPIVTYWPDLLKMTIKSEPTDAAVHYFTGWTDTYPTLKLLRAPSGLYWKNGLSHPLAYAQKPTGGVVVSNAESFNVECAMAAPARPPMGRAGPKSANSASLSKSAAERGQQ